MRRHILQLADHAATELRTPSGTRVERFDPTTLDGLPDPAQRFLRRVVPAGAPLVPAADLTMTGQIKVGRRWMPFTASQVIRAGVGFVWQPSVGGHLLRFVGADVLTPSSARMDFLVHGLVPVVSESGDDIRRSAAGRLAAETVAWLPHALTPQAGGRWTAIDDVRTSVAVPTPIGPIEVELEVNALGQLIDLELDRWSPDADPPADRRFGAAVIEERTHPLGVVAGEGFAGWDWHSAGQHDGEFFRYELSSWTPLDVASAVPEEHVIDLRDHGEPSAPQPMEPSDVDLHG